MFRIKKTAILKKWSMGDTQSIFLRLLSVTQNGSGYVNSEATNKMTFLRLRYPLILVGDGAPAFATGFRSAFEGMFYRISSTRAQFCCTRL